MTAPTSPEVHLPTVSLETTDFATTRAAPAAPRAAAPPAAPAAAPEAPAVAAAPSTPIDRPPSPRPGQQPRPRLEHRPRMAPEAPRPHVEGEDATGERTATAPQLRRFIKSRAYVPMHELRRRFAINGGDDEVTPVDLEPRKRVFVGLPEREGRLLGELLRAGDIGYELSLDPISPIVVGVYPMRPVTRV
jgi:hypothetical protein